MRKAHAKTSRAPIPIGLSIILPTHDDVDRLERHLPPLIAYLNTLRIPYEIIISDDGGRDPWVLVALCERLGCRLVRSERNRGKGAAVRRAMEAAQGKVRLFTDSEIPFRFTSIGEIYRKLDRGDADVVCGDRASSRSRYFSQLPPLRRLASRVFSFLTFGLSGNHFDSQCGLKGFRAEAAKVLFSAGRIDRYAFDVELIHIARRRGLKVDKEPVRLRVQSGSQIRPVRDGFRMLWDLARIHFYAATGRYGRRKRR